MNDRLGALCRQLGEPAAGADVPPLELDYLDDQMDLWAENVEQKMQEAQAWTNALSGRR